MNRLVEPTNLGGPGPSSRRDVANRVVKSGPAGQ